MTCISTAMNTGLSPIRTPRRRDPAGPHPNDPAETNSRDRCSTDCGGWYHNDLFCRECDRRYRRRGDSRSYVSRMRMRMRHFLVLSP
jgi:hypothetical protein